MNQFIETYKPLINIIMPKNSLIEKFDSSIYNSELLVSTCDIICVRNGRFFHFDEDGKLDMHVILKIIYPNLKNSHLVFSLNALK